MLKILIRLIALLCSMIVASQTGTVKGTIMNQNNKPVELVEVILINKDSIALKSEFTNSNGIFEMQTEKGEYVLQARENGKIVYKQTINLMDNLDLGNIKIIENKQQLNEVVVTSKKKLIERKVDRLVFNVENSISATGGDAIDALKITPSIRVQDEQISMVGKSGLAVMVDDKIIQLTGEDLINFLKSIQSDNIKSIEVITTPPAKYEADGNSGIVNIKLKKAKLDSWNMSVNSAYKQSTYATGTIGNSFNYQKDKLSLFSNLNYVKGAIKRTENDEIYYPTQIWITDFNKKLYSNGLNGRIGLDYNVTNKWSTGIQYLGSKNNPKTNEKDFGVISNNKTPINFYIITNAENIKMNLFNSLNWHNNIDIDTLGRKISTDFDYFTLSNNNNRNFATQELDKNYNQISNGFLSTNNMGIQTIKNYSGKIDFEHPLSFANLSYGIKISFTETNNELKFFDTTTGNLILNTNQSNTFNLKENIQSLYFSGDKKFGNEKWEAKIGLRMENTQTLGLSLTLNQNKKNSYLEYFPTTYLQYTYNEKHIFSLDYGRRIQRPSYSSLNPFKFYSSKYSYSEGNANLLPQFSNTIELKHAYNDFLFSSLFYLNETQGIGDVPFVDVNTNTQYFTKLNYFSFNSFGLSESYTFKRYDWWESNNELYVSYAKSKFTNNILEETKGLGFSVSTNNTFILNKSKTIKGAINYSYTGPQYDLLYKNEQTSSLDLSLKFSPTKNNIQIALVSQDILRSNLSYRTTYTNNLKQISSSYGDRRFFRISIVYKFGNKKVNVEKRDFGNDNEKDRTD
jgi:hypothetical protein